MSQSNFYRLILFFIVVLFFSCSAPKKLREKQFGTNVFYFKPLANLIHSSNDTSSLLLEFDADQLLYSRKSTHENFSAQIEVVISIEKRS